MMDYFQEEIFVPTGTEYTIVDSSTATTTEKEDTNAGFGDMSRIVQVFRIARIMRIFKLARSSQGLQVLK